MPSDKSDKAEPPVWGLNGAVLNSAQRGGEEKQRANSYNSDQSKMDVERFADRQPKGRSRFSWIKSISKSSAIIAVMSLAASKFGMFYYTSLGDIELSIFSLSSVIGYLMTVAVVSGFVAAFSFVTWHQLNEKRANQS